MVWPVPANGLGQEDKLRPITAKAAKVKMIIMIAARPLEMFLFKNIIFA